MEHVCLSGFRLLKGLIIFFSILCSNDLNSLKFKLKGTWLFAELDFTQKRSIEKGVDVREKHSLGEYPIPVKYDPGLQILQKSRFPQLFIITCPREGRQTVIVILLILLITIYHLTMVPNF